MVQLPKKKKKKNAAWRKDMLIEHQGEYLAKGFEDCTHTEYLNVSSSLKQQSAQLWCENQKWVKKHFVGSCRILPNVKKIYANFPSIDSEGWGGSGGSCSVLMDVLGSWS